MNLATIGILLGGLVGENLLKLELLITKNLWKKLKLDILSVKYETVHEFWSKTEKKI